MRVIQLILISVPSEWGEWSSCSSTCGGGKRSRTRECKEVSRSKEDNPCNVPLEEEEDCNPAPCPVYTEWSEWSSCSATCGGGRQERVRECRRVERLKCQGEPKEERSGKTHFPYTICT